MLGNQLTIGPNDPPGEGSRPLVILDIAGVVRHQQRPVPRTHHTKRRPSRLDDIGRTGMRILNDAPILTLPTPDPHIGTTCTTATQQQTGGRHCHDPDRPRPSGQGCTPAVPR
jgi:hypothetical protein